MDITKVNEALGVKFGFSSMDTLNVIRQLNLPKEVKILDVGTGLGNLAIMLALNGYKVLTGEPGDDESIYAKQDWLANSKKVNVDHMIEYKPFDAGDIPYEDNSFDAVFSLGTFHHIEEENRATVLQEFIRVSKSDAIICFFEPNRKALSIIMENDPSHPDAADPGAYIQDLGLTCRKIDGVHFDASVLQKQ